MAELTIKYFQGSSSPSVLVNGELSDYLLRQFVGGELRPLEAGWHFLRQVQTRARLPNFDNGFGNAGALSVEDENAIFEHVVASIPSCRLPLRSSGCLPTFSIAIDKVVGGLWPNPVSNTAMFDSSVHRAVRRWPVLSMCSRAA